MRRHGALLHALPGGDGRANSEGPAAHRAHPACATAAAAVCCAH